ncbi:MAG: TIGR02221 family CRISPR-associated protein [Scytonema sp. RU_4_4]|nr:TIGR02221 family CRISPR-associated protein [Scytonema sp. RU_4_4]
MAKILVSSLGVGGKFKNSDTHDREYKKTCYQIEDKSYPDSTFMASVLYEHFNLDGIIFIGTVKSMWEEGYRFFCQKNSVPLNENYWYNLASIIDKLTYKSDLDSLDLSPFEKVLGNRSKCILIKYGLNEQELWFNFNQILKIVDFLEKDDELYIDITHSFRSLSLFLFLTITFIRDLMSEKNIKIAGVYYGMLDATAELNYTPVVDLKPLFEMTSWIKGAYSLKSYGDGSLIAELLKSQGEEQLASQIEQLSHAININYVRAIQQRSSTLKTTLQNTQYNQAASSPFKYLRTILENFVQKFARSSIPESEYQLKLAGWYFENKRYATGYITLAEAIITYLCEINGRNITMKYERDEMKKFLKRSDNEKSKLAELYSQVNLIRNSIAHALLEEDKKIITDSDAINKAKGYQQEVKKIFRTGTLDY